MHLPPSSSTSALAHHVAALLSAPTCPPLPETLAGSEEAEQIHTTVCALRDALEQFANGDFTGDITCRGVIAGYLKMLQANLKHLVWQFNQVAEGDFSQHVDFIGDFGTSFNTMISRFEETLLQLQAKERELTQTAEALQKDIQEKARVLEELRESEASFRYKASHDPLTGLLNRRSFYDLAIAELQRSKKRGLPCCVAIFDIDNFKRFNDGYGHIEGDAAIRHATQLGKEALRAKDIMGRFGGDEITMLFAASDEASGRKIAERLLTTVANTPVSISKGEAFITISLGLVCVPPTTKKERDTIFLERAIARADEALYMAKRSGRNRVAVVPFSTDETRKR